MTRRFFYTDPLAAAWMEKNVGMRIHDGDQDKECDFRLSVSNGKKLYVHPASLSLLEPQVDDICMCRMHLDDPASEIVPYRIHVPKTKHDVVAVIQRNGVAFMWPESEEV
jgi:hypothetical protein